MGKRVAREIKEWMESHRTWKYVSYTEVRGKVRTDR